MKYLFTLIVSLISLSSFSQQITYKEWQEEAKTNSILLPEYGNVTKTKDQIKADDDFIALCLKSDTTHRKASEHLVSLGFTYLYRGDLKTAMSRFNLAWLLDSKNANVYWGYGVIYFGFNDMDEAFKQFDRGLLLDPKCSNILTDKATLYMSMFMNKNDIADLNKAIELFNSSYKIDPLNQNTLFKLSAAYFYKKDCANANKFYNECMKLGGQPITKEYTEALKKMCSN